MYVRNKKGFTLVELLAVLVILAVILVIAVPKVMSIIKDVRISTLESTAKLVALSAEKKKVENEIIGNNEILTCENVVKINDVDYESCYIEFIDNKAVVTIIGKGTFKGMNACEATKTNANITERCLNKKVEVTLELNGGSAPDITGIYKEGTVIDLEEPIKENSTFTSYKIVSGNSTITNNKLTVGSTNTIIHAMYESWPSLEVDLDGGTDTVDYNETYKSGSIIELEVPTKAGYTFTGWNVESGNSELSGNTLTIGNKDTKVKANYTLNTYKVTFNPKDGTVDTTYKNVTYSNIYGEMPTPVKEGYMFIGWYNEDDIEVISTDKVEILNDIELTAKYIKNEFEYTGNYETFIVPKDGNYKIELWGASGGSYNNNYPGGAGGYVAGNIFLEKNDKLYFYVGGQPSDYRGGYNGGGTGTHDFLNGDIVRNFAGGGGATDVRLNKGEVNNFESLKSRIMVAGAGSAGYYWETKTTTTSNWSLFGQAGGGLIGSYYESVIETCVSTGGTQTKGGVCDGYSGVFGGFGYGGSGMGSSTSEKEANAASGGGSGYYGGAGRYDLPSSSSVGGGGSSFISGHNGCDAIKEESTENNIIHTGQSIHYSNYVFTNTVMIDGNGYNWTNVKGSYTGMPSYNSKSIITGNIGNGYAKITYLEEK